MPSNINLDPKLILKKEIKLEYIDNTICLNPNPKTELFLKDNQHLLKLDYLVNHDWGINFLIKNNKLNYLLYDLTIDNDIVVDYILNSNYNKDIHTSILQNKNNIIVDIILNILNKKPNIYKEEYTENIKKIEKILECKENIKYELSMNENEKIIDYFFDNLDNEDIFYEKAFYSINNNRIADYVIKNNIKNLDLLLNSNKKIINYVLENNYFNNYNTLIFLCLKSSKNKELFAIFMEKYINHISLYEFGQLIFSRENNSIELDNIICNKEELLSYIYFSKDSNYVKNKNIHDTFYNVGNNLENEYNGHGDMYIYNSFRSYRIKMKVIYNINVKYDITRDDIFN